MRFSSLYLFVSKIMQKLLVGLSWNLVERWGGVREEAILLWILLCFFLLGNNTLFYYLHQRGNVSVFCKIVWRGREWPKKELIIYSVADLNPGVGSLIPQWMINGMKKNIGIVLGDWYIQGQIQLNVVSLDDCWASTEVLCHLVHTLMTR